MAARPARAADAMRLLRRGLDWLFRGCAYASIAVLSGAMLVTMADIAIRAVARASGQITGQGLQLAVPGVVDLVQLFVTATAYFAIPFAFAVNAHVSVDILATRLPRRVQSAMQGIAALLAAAVMAAILYYGWQQASLQHSYGDKSQTIGIPILWYWGPLLFGAALSVIAVSAQAVRHLGDAAGLRTGA